MAGCGVWLTRPSGQNAAWRPAIEQAGGQVIEQPLLDIAEAPAPVQARDALLTAQQADYLIATSANAVRGAWALLPNFAPQGRLLAVGQATAAALAHATGRSVDTPDSAQSEGLLELDMLSDIDGMRIAILAGVGGRELLEQALTRRGARVDKLALYQRVPAVIGPDRMASLLEQSDVIVVTSGEALSHLLRLASQYGMSLATHGLVAPSIRVVQQASHALDWAMPPIALEQMGAAHVVDAVARLWPRRRQ